MKRGFTLLEVMIALALLGLGMVVLIKSAAGNIFSTEDSRMMGIATDLARGVGGDAAQQGVGRLLEQQLQIRLVWHRGDGLHHALDDRVGDVVEGLQLLTQPAEEASRPVFGCGSQQCGGARKVPVDSGSADPERGGDMRDAGLGAALGHAPVGGGDDARHGFIVCGRRFALPAVRAHPATVAP